MPQGKHGAPQVDIFPDHEIITPVNRLEKAVVRRVVLAGDNPVARAEAALNQLSGEFGAWMNAECDRLDSARRAVHEHGLSERTLDELFRAAHDVKGDAATFGFPLAAGVAESLCRMIEHSPDRSRIPIALVDQHVDAVRAIVREYGRADIIEVATTLTRRLRQVSDEYLVHENRHRPEYLEGLVAPSIVPGNDF